MEATMKRRSMAARKELTADEAGRSDFPGHFSARLPPAPKQGSKIDEATIPRVGASLREAIRVFIIRVFILIVAL